jgi:tRNA (guanine37-N1)-methyltransferase
VRVIVITIFPELFREFLNTSLVGRAITGGTLEVVLHDLRDFASDPHRSVDDEPFGGGAGMVMAAPPWIRAVSELAGGDRPWRVLLSPQGRRLTDAIVRELAERKRLLLLCGRYEGIDERVRETVVDEEISIGDYVLSGGELPAMVLIEALSRQVPGVVGRRESVEQDSFRRGMLDFPHYTRPRVVLGRGVPEVLLSGDHAAIREWRERQSLLVTWRKRPDLLATAALTVEQQHLLSELQHQGLEPQQGGAKTCQSERRQR